MYCATFSIVARDAATGCLGVATASRALAAGAKVITVVPGTAAVASQSWASQVVGRRTAALCGQGHSAEAALQQALAEDVADPAAGKQRDSRHRQVIVIDSAGGIGMHTGEIVLETAKPYAGHRCGTDYAVAGNLLTGADVLAAMAEAFEAADASEPLARRLVAALAAGEAAGGDSRGKRAAAVQVAPPVPVHGEKVFPTDFRVDDHPDPVGELTRLLSLGG